MTLQNWLDKHEGSVLFTSSFGVKTLAWVNDTDARAELYHLNDYKVNTVAAGTIILCPV